MKRKRYGLVYTVKQAGKYRRVQRARAKSKAKICVLMKVHEFKNGVVHLVRYWIETDSVTIHRYSADFYADNFPGNGVFYRKKKNYRRPPGYSRKWDNL